MIRTTLLPVLLAAVAVTAVASAEVTLDAAASAAIGSTVEVSVTGSTNPMDFVSIVAPNTKEGAYDAYQYVRPPGVVKLTAPAKPGDYEIRVLSGDTPYPTLARRPLRVEAVTVSLDAPARVAAGDSFKVQWTGPDNLRDYVGIGDAKRPYIVYAYTKAGNPVALTAPDEPGEYELRYFLGEGNTVIGTRAISVGGVEAAVSAPAKVAAGAAFAVTWTGPDHPRDFITLVAAGSPARRYERYVYTTKGSPLELVAPEQPGPYEVRYLTGQSYATLASTNIEVTPIQGSIEGPAEVVAGSTFQVRWEGPDNPRDYVTLVSTGAREGESGNYAYTAAGNPASLLAPLERGDYELRYSMGQSHATLARQAIRVTPGTEEPGFVSVTVADVVSSGNAIEIILDASGSMLQRIGSERRIDIARRTLTQLVSEDIAAGTPFALRVFGREVDSCQTDLEVPLGPLDRAAVSARIGKLEAKNNAKTPIGASLEKVADDLRTVRGERLVILLTDGEETCGGDPAATIAELVEAGASLRVNIVGFAIDDPRLAATFRHWSDTGGGLYFDVNDAAGLGQALSQATQPAIELVDGKGQVVAQGLAGAPLSAMPGAYIVRLKGQSGKSQSVTIRSKETASVRF